LWLQLLAAFFQLIFQNLMLFVISISGEYKREYHEKLSSIHQTKTTREKTTPPNLAPIPLTAHPAPTNEATRELKQLLSDNYNASFQQNLSPTASTDYSLWKAVKRIKHIPSSSPPPTSNSSWHLGTYQHRQSSCLRQPFSMFSSHTPPTYLMRRNPRPSFGISLPTRPPPPFQRFNKPKFKQSSTTFLPKLPVYDLITGKILQELPPVGIKYINIIQLLKASLLLLGYFPNQWKVAQIILLLKPANILMSLHPTIL
jgi:hypothetical protein